MKFVETTTHIMDKGDEHISNLVGRWDDNIPVSKERLVLVFSDSGQFQFSLYPNTSSSTGEEITTITGTNGEVIHDVIQPIDDFIRSLKSM